MGQVHPNVFSGRRHLLLFVLAILALVFDVDLWKGLCLEFDGRPSTAHLAGDCFLCALLVLRRTALHVHTFKGTAIQDRMGGFLVQLEPRRHL